MFLGWARPSAFPWCCKAHIWAPKYSSLVFPQSVTPDICNPSQFFNQSQCSRSNLASHEYIHTSQTICILPLDGTLHSQKRCCMCWMKFLVKESSFQDLGLVSLCKITKLDYQVPGILSHCLHCASILHGRYPRSRTFSFSSYVYADTSSINIAAVVAPFFYPSFTDSLITIHWLWIDMKVAFETHMQPHYAKH